MAAYQVTEDDRPEHTQLVPLALLVMGDEEARDRWPKARPSPLMAANWPAPPRWSSKAVGQVAREFAVLDVFRRYRDFKPQGIAELNEGGRKAGRRSGQRDR